MPGKGEGCLDGVNRLIESACQPLTTSHARGLPGVSIRLSVLTEMADFAKENSSYSVCACPEP